MFPTSIRSAGIPESRSLSGPWFQRLTQTCLLACLYLTVAMSAAPTPALAQPGPTARERARTLLEQGAQLYSKRDFKAAFARFKAAYDVFPTPKINYNFGLIYEATGKAPQAVMEYERFLRGAQDATPETIADAKKRLERLSGKVGFLNLSSDAADAEAFLDGVPVGKVADLGSLPVEVGKHDIVARSRQLGSQSRSFTVAAGQVVQLRVELRAAGTGTKPAEPSAADVARLDDAAEQLVLKAVELRKQQKHLEAYELFQRAHQMSPRPRPTAQLGLVEYQLGKWVDSEGHLEHALQTGKSDPFIRANLQTIEEALAVVRSHIGYVSVNGTPPGAEVIINGRKAGPLPLRLAKASTGTAEVLVTAPGHAPERRTVTLEPQLTQELFVTLVPQASGRTAGSFPGSLGASAETDDPTEARAGIGPMRISGLLVGAAGLAAIGYGAYQTYQVQNLSSMVARQDRAGINRGQTAEKRQWLGYGAGAAGLAVGGLLWWLSKPGDSEPRAVSLLLLPHLDGGLIGLQMIR
jgi:tetratricopeptide (TPR) repeat protein